MNLRLDKQSINFIPNFFARLSEPTNTVNNLFYVAWMKNERFTIFFKKKTYFVTIDTFFLIMGMCTIKLHSKHQSVQKVTLDGLKV